MTAMYSRFTAAFGLFAFAFSCAEGGLSTVLDENSDLVQVQSRGEETESKLATCVVVDVPLTKTYGHVWDFEFEGYPIEGE